MDTLMQITNKEILVEQLETIIREYCVQEGLALSNMLHEELKESTDEILAKYNKDGQDLSPIEGTYFLHAIYNTLFPDLYVSWWSSYRQSQQMQDAVLEVTTKKDYVINTYAFELPERLLVQELKQITQKRFNALQTNSTIELFHSGTYIEIQPASSNIISKEILKIYMQMEKVEKNYDTLIRRLCPLH